MSETTKPAAESKAKPEKKFLVQPVHGRMVHVLTGVVFDGTTEVKEIDSWLQAQIDAGKIVLA
jgi:hypothetical protein